MPSPAAGRGGLGGTEQAALGWHRGGPAARG